MINEIREYIAKCPLLADGKINVNYLDAEPITYSIDSVPSNPVITRYADGGQLCRELFVIASRELYSKKVSDNAKVARFYEEFAGWIEEQDRKRNFPDLPAPLSAQSIEVLTGGYLFDLGEMDARYQIQCALTYYKD